MAPRPYRGDKKAPQDTSLGRPGPAGLDPNLITLISKSGAPIEAHIIQRYPDGSVDLVTGAPGTMSEVFRMNPDGTFRFRDPRVDTALSWSNPKQRTAQHLKIQRESADRMEADALNILLGQGDSKPNAEP
jgi:hypothetical protein